MSFCSNACIGSFLTSIACVNIRSYWGKLRGESSQDQGVISKMHTCPMGLGTEAVAGMPGLCQWKEGGRHGLMGTAWRSHRVLPYEETVGQEQTLGERVI